MEGMDGEERMWPLRDGTGPRPARGTRRGVSPSATKRPSGMGGRYQVKANTKILVATPSATEGDGSSDPKTLYNQIFRKGPSGDRTV